MKFLSVPVTSVFFAIFVVATGHSMAQTLPLCTTSSSDTDEDGYGWENNASCIVASGSSPSAMSQCEDHGGYPWGWNSTTRESCRLDGQSQMTDTQVETSPATTDQIAVQSLPECTTSISDIDGDGYGWEYGASCIVPSGSSLSGSTPSAMGQCEDQGAYPWGINSITRELCRFDELCIDTDPLNDGWGCVGNSCLAVGDTCTDPNGVDFGPRPSSDPNNLIKNGTFDGVGDFVDPWWTSTPYWTTYIHPSVVDSFFHYGRANGFGLGNLTFRFGGITTGSEWWHSQVYSAPIALEGGRTYRLSFDHQMATRSRAHGGSVVVENGTDFTKYLDRQDFKNSGQRLRYQVEFYMPVSDTNARVTFNFGDSCPQCDGFGGSSSYDNVVLIAID